VAEGAAAAAAAVVVAAVGGADAMALATPPGGGAQSACDAAYNHASRHRAELAASASCGCFYCFRLFTFGSIARWKDDGQTALCPKCGIDAVLGDASGFPVTDKFLRTMHRHWFTMNAKR
jgi:hypothetical protein